jgi:hypothetical protein
VKGGVSPPWSPFFPSFQDSLFRAQQHGIKEAIVVIINILPTPKYYSRRAPTGNGDVIFGQTLSNPNRSDRIGIIVGCNRAIATL